MFNNALMVELDFSTELTPAQRFEEFNSRNPQVYQALEDMAFQLVKRGRKKIGINMLLEVLETVCCSYYYLFLIIYGFGFLMCVSFVEESPLFASKP